MSHQSAIVYRYQDDTTGWVIRYGDTVNQEIDDPATQTLVSLDDTAVPLSKPLRKQRIDSNGFFIGFNVPEDRDAMRIWLASQFVSGRTTLLEPASVAILNTTPIILGSWMSDSRGGVDGEGSDGRVFGAIFRWESPVAGRPPVLICRGDSPDGTEKHDLTMYGEATKKQNSPTTNFEFWSMVTSAKIPLTYRNWRLELSVPSLLSSESCVMESLRVSKGKRGV